MMVRLTVWNKYDNVQSHVYYLDEALRLADVAANRVGFVKAVVQSETVTADEAVRQG